MNPYKRSASCALGVKLAFSAIEQCMTQLLKIQDQIKQLQQEAEKLRARDFAATVQDIRTQMTAFGITIKDLQAPRSKRGRPRSVKASSPVTGKSSKGPRKATLSRSPVLAKYKGPEGQTWTGRGLTPKWLTALLANGGNRDEFLIKAP